MEENITPMLGKYDSNCKLGSLIMSGNSSTLHTKYAQESCERMNIHKCSEKKMSKFESRSKDNDFYTSVEKPLVIESISLSSQRSISSAEKSAYITCKNTFNSAEFDMRALVEHEDSNELSKRMKEVQIKSTPFLRNFQFYRSTKLPENVFNKY